MTKADASASIFDGDSPNRAAIGRVVAWEFDRFREFFKARLDADEAQRLRGVALQWWSTFAPEAIPGRVSAGMRDLVVESRLATDHSSFGWIETLPLCSALAWIHADPMWLEESLGNLAHHNSALRRHVATSLSLAAPLIGCDDAKLVTMVARNFESHHFSSDYGLAVFVGSNGTREAKSRQIAEWCTTFDPETPGYGALASLRDHEFMSNPFVANMLWAQSYIAVRLVSDSTGASLAAVDLPSTGSLVDGSQAIWARLQRHPLCGAFVELARPS